MEPFQERHRLSEPLYEPKAAAGEQVSSELEDILSDRSLSGWSRFKKATWLEMRTLYILAAPAVIVYLLNNVISTSTQIFGGHLGNVERAAASIGNNRMHLLNYGLLLGMGSSVETVCGQAYGAHKNEMLGVYMQKSAILLTATGILMMIDYIFCKPIQVLFGDSPRVASATALYVYGLIPQIFAYAANFPIQKFLQAQNIVNPSAYIAAATLVVHVFLAWLVLYVFEWGLVGVALVSSLSWWIIVVAQFVYILRSERCKTTWTGFSRKAFSGLWSFWKLSSASAVLMCLETWYFQITVLLAGLLPNPEVTFDSLSICGTIIGWAFMISVGFNAAASVRVSNEVGAGHPKSASFAVVVVTLISTIISTTFAVVSLGFRHQLSYIFTGGTTLSDAISDLAPLMAIYIVLNGIHPVLSGVAIGCGWQVFVCNVSLGCYYAVGVPLGALLGFKFNLGAKGIWLGMLGGVAMQTIILLWVTVRTDWNKEVEKAQDKLQNWEDSKGKVLLEE